MDKHQGSGRGTVLVVEDEPGVRRAVVRMVVRLGFDVLETDDGVEAVTWLRDHPGETTAVLLDLQMPELDGATALVEFRRIEPALPVLVLSGYAPEDAGGLLGDTTPAAYIQKPFTAEELKDALDGALHRAG